MSLATLEQVTEEPQVTSRTSEARRAFGFVRERWVAVVVTSLVVIIPCFWHSHIEAGDLGSHTYNAWLATLVEQGRAPGLFIAHQWTNIIVDSMLTWLGGAFGFGVAEKIVVCFCVLCFFWGAFAFIAASTRRAPWMVSPAIGMITYGFTFYAGFMNFYLSLGLAFFAAAVSWRGTRRDWILAGALAALSLMAHPMGFGLLVSLVAYIHLGATRRRKISLVRFRSRFAFIGSPPLRAAYVSNLRLDSSEIRRDERRGPVDGVRSAVSIHRAGRFALSSYRLRRGSYC